MRPEMCVVSRRSCTNRFAAFFLLCTSLFVPVLATKANPPKNRVVANLQVSNPSDPVCSPDSKYVYVASNNSNFTQGQIIVISVATHEVISQFAAGAQALGLAISPDGQTLYSCDDNSNIQIISTADQTVTATINLNVPVITGFAPILALSPDGTSLWVATVPSATQAIYVINTATDQVASTTIPLWATSLG
jgi:DNA-binding beta-propeller fold protein YncE